MGQQHLEPVAPTSEAMRIPDMLMSSKSVSGARFPNTQTTVRCLAAHAERTCFMKLKDTIQKKTGIYDLGFNPYSVLGIALPVLFVLVVGGGLAAFILLR